MKIIKGNLISLALAGEFDVIAHGCNCFCKQKSGIAKQMASTFNTDTFPLEMEDPGRINKLGSVDTMEYEIKMSGLIVREDYKGIVTHDVGNLLTIVNCYTQYRYGRNHPDGDYAPLDYEALILCMKKINHIFKGKKVGLPWIGCGLAGGSKERVKQILKQELTDVDLTIVEL